MSQMGNKQTEQTHRRIQNKSLLECFHLLAFQWATLKVKTQEDQFTDTFSYLKVKGLKRKGVPML
jgi:hypothetical protein